MHRGEQHGHEQEHSVCVGGEGNGVFARHIEEHYRRHHHEYERSPQVGKGQTEARAHYRHREHNIRNARVQALNEPESESRREDDTREAKRCGKVGSCHAIDCHSDTERRSRRAEGHCVSEGSCVPQRVALKGMQSGKGKAHSRRSRRDKILLRDVAAEETARRSNSRHGEYQPVGYLGAYAGNVPHSKPEQEHHSHKSGEAFAVVKSQLRAREVCRRESGDRQGKGQDIGEVPYHALLRIFKGVYRNVRGKEQAYAEGEYRKGLVTLGHAYRPEGADHQHCGEQRVRHEGADGLCGGEYHSRQEYQPREQQDALMILEAESVLRKGGKSEHQYRHRKRQQRSEGTGGIVLVLHQRVHGYDRRHQRRVHGEGIPVACEKREAQRYREQQVGNEGAYRLYVPVDRRSRCRQTAEQYHSLGQSERARGSRQLREAEQQHEGVYCREGLVFQEYAVGYDLRRPDREGHEAGRRPFAPNMADHKRNSRNAVNSGEYHREYAEGVAVIFAALRILPVEHEYRERRHDIEEHSPEVGAAVKELYAHEGEGAKPAVERRVNEHSPLVELHRRRREQGHEQSRPRIEQPEAAAVVRKALSEKPEPAHRHEGYGGEHRAQQVERHARIDELQLLARYGADDEEERRSEGDDARALPFAHGYPVRDREHHSRQHHQCRAYDQHDRSGIALALGLRWNGSGLRTGCILPSRVRLPPSLLRRIRIDPLRRSLLCGLNALHGSGLCRLHGLNALHGSGLCRLCGLYALYGGSLCRLCGLYTLHGSGLCRLRGLYALHGRGL